MDEDNLTGRPRNTWMLQEAPGFLLRLPLSWFVDQFAEAGGGAAGGVPHRRVTGDEFSETGLESRRGRKPRRGSGRQPATRAGVSHAVSRHLAVNAMHGRWSLWLAGSRRAAPTSKNTPIMEKLRRVWEGEATSFALGIGWAQSDQLRWGQESCYIAPERKLITTKTSKDPYET
jgi:hypothetical protein